MDKNYDFFMRTNVDRYLGEWIAICNEKIVSHGKEFKKVIAEAKRVCPHETPFVARLPEKGTMIYPAW